MLKSLMASRWWPMVELAGAAAACLWWAAAPDAGWAPVVLAALPAGLGLTNDRGRSRHAWLVALLAVFLATAAVGVWAAYDPALALRKFWMLVGAVCLCYALARLPVASLWLTAGLLAGLAALTSAAFLLIHDFQKYPVQSGFVSRIGAWWTSVRPGLTSTRLDTDIVAGVIVLLMPFTIALVVRALRERRSLPLSLAGAGLVVSLVGLFMTAERGEWLVLGFALCTWLLWLTARRLVPAVEKLQPVKAIAILALLAVVSVPVVAVQGIAWEGRWEIIGNSLRLARDYAFTGGGLMSFAGLYSRYILVIPWEFIPQSVNLALDTVIEQGIVGLLALVSVMVLCVWSLLKRPLQDETVPHFQTLYWACFSSLLVFLIYGLLEDPYHDSWGTLFLFVPAGLALALSQSPRSDVEFQSAPVRRVSWLPVGVVTLLFAAALISFLTPSVRSAWLSNLGAVAMSRIEIAGFPGQPHYWNGLTAPELDQPRQTMEQALALDPGNLTANYRLGLIAAVGDDYGAANRYWLSAYQADSQHRGLQKMLGYSFVWTGHISEARKLLAAVPEAQNEMTTYAWWWKTQGYADRSEYAAEMAQQLAGQ